ncbi:MAG: hypothetical protein ACK417_03055 [Bacteroidia bacterium]
MKTIMWRALPLITMAFVQVACQNAEQSARQESAAPVAIEQVDTMLQLNGAERWQMNREMQLPVAASEALLQSYVNSGAPDADSLARSLRKLSKELISSCKMEGQGHDELHKWLHPYLKQLSELENAASAEQQYKIANVMYASFEELHRYFQ